MNLKWLKNINVQKKLLLSFGILTLAVLIMAFMLFTGLKNINQAREEMTKLGRVDMVMNEAVIQNMIKVRENFNSWTLNPSEENWKQLQDNLNQTTEGLEGWKEVAGDYPELVHSADSGVEALQGLEGKINTYQQSLDKRSQIYEDWMELIDNNLNLLEETMENQIDPMKARAAEEGNITAMNKWGDIDMIMNEAVIANFLKLKANTNLYIQNPKEYNQELDLALKRLEEGVGEWEEVCSGEKELIAVISELRKNIAEYKDNKNRFEKEYQTATRLNEEINNELTSLVGNYESIMANEVDPMKEKAAENVAAVSQNLRTKMIILVLVVVFVILSSLYVTNKLIVAPLKKMADFTEYIKQGDFSNSLEIERDDELGLLADGFNQIQLNLHKIISNITKIIDDLSAHSQELSASAEEGNATIETTNQLVENMSANIQQISASAEEVTSFAQESNAKTETGAENIEETLESMGDISQAVNRAVKIINDLDENSKEISKIVDLITNIAEQTNMLALNASIEAARAGKEGEGFAVVAEEIRTLAEETDEATTEIIDLIDETQNKTDAGLEAIKEVRTKVAKGEEVVEITGELFTEIEDASAETAAQIEQTAAATQDLATSSDKIMDASSEIQNMSDEVTKSSQELVEITDKLQKLINKFKI